MASELDTLRARIAALEELCGNVYQALGALGAPVEVLDTVFAAAQGEDIPDPQPLFSTIPTDYDEVQKRQAIINSILTAIGPTVSAERGRAGGSVSSTAKRRAARANGQKGGRPRKSVAAR
jgi:hypothetical protein